jgi:glycosyltransferase involved in cell wall biosynthesis
MAVANAPYPQDSRVRNEALTLVAEGWRVSVIAPRHAGQVRCEVLDGVEVLRYAAPPALPGTLGYVVEFAFVTLLTALHVLGLLARGRVDVLHLHNPPDTLALAALLPRVLGVRIVFDLHDLAPELYRARVSRPSRLIDAALRAFESLSLRLAHRVVTVNESYRRRAADRSGRALDQIVVVRNAPPLARLEPEAPDPEIRAMGPALIGYLGMLGPQDGADHMLHAFSRLTPEHGLEEWAAVIVGSVEEEGAVRALAERLGIAERVRFLGFQSDDAWRRILAAVDVGVVPDPRNGLNEHSTMIKIMEYMALGLPVAAYDLPEHRVSAGEAALYATPNDPSALAAILARLLLDPAERARRGHEGRRRIRDGLAWEHSAAHLRSLYEHLLPAGISSTRPSARGSESA